MLLDLTRIQGLRERVEREYPASALDTSQDEFRVLSAGLGAIQGAPPSEFAQRAVQD